jgi:hypothetical protein
MTAPWPCWKCGERGYRNLGRRGYCPTHLGELYRTFDPVVFDLTGFGLPLTCVACGATWAGLPGEACDHCRRSHAAMFEHQRALLLNPPSDGDERELVAWADRLDVAVTAGIVTPEAAEKAVRLVVRRAA